MECYWYAVPNDLIGGYTVANVNKPDSQHNVYEGDFEVGTFMTLEVAQHIADIHNAWWSIQVWNSYSDNLDWTTYRDYHEAVQDLTD
jgi:poly-beta-hydroxyalkanoate depolymerase